MPLAMGRSVQGRRSWLWCSQYDTTWTHILKHTTTVRNNNTACSQVMDVWICCWCVRFLLYRERSWALCWWCGQALHPTNATWQMALRLPPVQHKFRNTRFASLQLKCWALCSGRGMRTQAHIQTHSFFFGWVSKNHWNLKIYNGRLCSIA